VIDDRNPIEPVPATITNSTKDRPSTLACPIFAILGVKPERLAARRKLTVVPVTRSVTWIFYSKPLPAPRNPLILLRRVRNLTLT